MYLVAIAWLYVVVLMALAEGTSAQGTWLGASFTFLLYGALAARHRRSTCSARRPAAGPAAAPSAPQPRASAGVDPDGSGHAPGDAVAAEGKEP